MSFEESYGMRSTFGHEPLVKPREPEKPRPRLELAPGTVLNQKRIDADVRKAAGEPDALPAFRDNVYV